MAEQTNKKIDESLGYFALVLAWAVPGLGHLMIGQKGRGFVFFITLHGLFALGLLIGGIRAINPVDQPIWRYTQFLAGWPMLVANHFERNVYEPRYVHVDRGDGLTAINREYELGRPSIVDDNARPARGLREKLHREKPAVFLSSQGAGCGIGLLRAGGDAEPAGDF